MQEFKVSRQYIQVFLLFGVGMFGASLLFFFAFESAKIDIFHIVFFGLSVLIASIGAFGYWSLYLTISPEGIRMEDRWLGWLSYELSWSEVQPVMTIWNQLNKQTLFYFYAPESRMLKSLNPTLFEPVEGEQYLMPLTVKERIFGAKQPSAIERAVKQYAGETIAVDFAHIRSLAKNSSADLGKEAAVLAGASTILFAIGTVLLIWGGSKHLLAPNAYFWIGLASLSAAVIAIRVLPSDNKLAVALIAPLFAGCCAWFVVQSVHFYTLNYTEPQNFDYRLVESSPIFQVWQAQGMPDIDVYSDPDNLAYEEVGIIRTVQFHVGPLGFYDVSRAEVNQLFIKNQDVGLFAK